MWTQLDPTTDTRGAEVPGLGVVIGVPGLGMCFVPGARIHRGAVVRDTRTAPPIAPNGLSAAEIRAKQPLVVDPGALSYLVTTDDGEY